MPVISTSTTLLRAHRTSTMAAAQPRTAPAPRFYVDHDPAFEWLHEKDSDTLLIHLPEYKREYLKVRLDSDGNLGTGGERPLYGNRWTRFWKDFRLPQNCNVSAIRAKFENETLYVHLPKLITPAAEDHSPPAAEPKPERGAHDKNPKTGMRDESGTAEEEVKGVRKRSSMSAEKVTGEEQGKTPSAGETDDGKVAEHGRKVGGGNKIMDPPVRQKVSGGDEVSQQEAARYDMSAMAMEVRRQRKRLMVNIAVAAFVLVGLGVYICYRN